MPGLKLPKSLADQMVAHAREEAPNECCGVLAGKDGAVSRVYRAANLDHSPVKYRIDPRDEVRIFRDVDKEGLEVLAFYHSHTFTEAYPSVTDVKLAAPSDQWGYEYVLVSLADAARPAIRSFRIESGGQVRETALQVV